MDNIENRLFREYRLKFYLNANHYLIFNQKRGDTHPHTWEFTLNILIGRGELIEFHRFEKAIEDCLAPYQNKVMNNVEPFDSIVPTLENLVDYYGERIKNIVEEIGGKLISIEGSETPTRSYIVYFNDSNDSKEIGTYTEDVMREILDSVIDNIMDEKI